MRNDSGGSRFTRFFQSNNANISSSASNTMTSNAAVDSGSRRSSTTAEDFRYLNGNTALRYLCFTEACSQIPNIFIVILLSFLEIFG